MKEIVLTDVVKLCGARILQEKSGAESINGAYSSDLLSDVMANAEEGQALITIQAHKNTIAVASLFGAPCIIICNDRPVPEDMIAAAAEEEIAIFVSPMSQFEVSGKLYQGLFGSESA